MMLMMNDSKADADAVFLPEWFTPSDRDVICGWARQNHRHAGNQRFRKLVEHSAPLYLAANTKLEKTQVIATVVDKVRRDSPGGGFVKKDFHTNLWYEIGDDKARDKVGHAIRRVIEDGKKKSPKSKVAKAKKKAELSDDESATDYLTKLPHASLDDFKDDSQHHITSKPEMARSLNSHEEAKFDAPNFQQSSMLQDKADSLVVPSFLYQQHGPGGLASMAQDSGSLGRAPQGLELPSTGNMLAQNNQPLLGNMLTGPGSQLAGWSGDAYLQRTLASQFHQTDTQAKLGKVNDTGSQSDDFANKPFGGMSNTSAFNQHLGQQFNQNTNFDLLRGNQADSHHNLSGFLQMQQGVDMSQLGLPTFAGGLGNFEANQGLSNPDPLLGLRDAGFNNRSVVYDLGQSRMGTLGYPRGDRNAFNNIDDNNGFHNTNL